MTKAKATPAKTRKAAPAKGKAKPKTKPLRMATPAKGETYGTSPAMDALGIKPKRSAAAKPAPTAFADELKTNSEKISNREANGQLKPGTVLNPNGRPKGARHKLSQDFIKALADDFAENGLEAIQKLRLENGAAYVKAITAVLPKVIEVEDDDDDSGGKSVSGVILITRDRIRSLVDGGA